MAPNADVRRQLSALKLSRMNSSSERGEKIDAKSAVPEQGRSSDQKIREPAHWIPHHAQFTWGLAGLGLGGRTARIQCRLPPVLIVAPRSSPWQRGEPISSSFSTRVILRPVDCG